MLKDRIAQILGQYIHLSDPARYQDLIQYVMDRPWLTIRLLHGDIGAAIVLEADRLNRISQDMYTDQ